MRLNFASFDESETCIGKRSKKSIGVPRLNFAGFRWRYNSALKQCGTKGFAFVRFGALCCAGSPPPVRRASRRPRAAWAPPARSRSQPARGRRPVRGAVRSRRNKAAQRSPLRRRCCSGVYAGAGAGRLTVSPYCSSFGFAQTCFPPNDVNSFCFLLLII